MISQYVNLYFPFCSMALSILLCVLFFTKKKIKNVDNSIYSRLVIFTLIESTIMFFTNLLVCICYSDETKLIFELLNKILYSVYILWLTIFFFYIYRLGGEKTTKTINVITAILDIVLIILIFVTPIDLYYENYLTNSSGTSSNILYVGCSIYLVLMMVFAFVNTKKNKYSKKYLPLLLLLILMGIMMIIRQIDPLLNISSNILSFVTLVMFFTIENPDVKLLNEVKISKAEAEKANNAKSTFLKNMSHEIATPINKAKGINYLNIESTDAKEMKENALIIDEYLTQLSDISKNIIDVIKLESNSLTLENNVYYPEKLFEDIEKITLRKIETKNIEFKLKLGKLPNALYGDSSKIKHIISELLANSIKYTEKGKITLLAKSEINGNKCKLYIEIKDTGIGIKKENQKELFNRFSRIDLDKNITINGMGLGLSICKQLIEMMNGNINVESEYGKGSKFYFKIEQELMERK